MYRGGWGGDELCMGREVREYLMVKGLERGIWARKGKSNAG